MRLSVLAIVSLSFWIPASTLAQESDESPSAESIRNATCAAAGVDLSKPESDMTRSEQRAVRRCTRDADRIVASTENTNDEGLICRRESTVGTHQRRRVCTTQAQREAMRESTNEVLREVTRPRGDLGPEG